MQDCNNHPNPDPSEAQQMGKIVRDYTRLKMLDGVRFAVLEQQLLAAMERGASDYYKEVGIDDPNATQEIPAVKLDDEPSAAFRAGESFAVTKIMQEAADNLSTARDAVTDEGMTDVLRDS